MEIVTVPADYLVVAVFALTAVAFVAMTLGLSSLLRPHNPTPQKHLPYECGELPKGGAWIQFNFRFYVFALLFVVFDVEALFLIPWAVRYKTFIHEQMGGIVLIEMTLFLGMLLLALGYAWKKNALRWLK